MLLLTGPGKIAVSPGFCRDRMCPTCQQRRSRTVAARCTALTVRMDAPRLMTFTLKAANRPLFLTIAAVLASFKELRKSTEWRRHVTGGVYVLEITRGAKGTHWHAHIHVICDGQFWHQRDLSRVWKRVTGDSEIVDIRAVHSRGAAANYVAKYVSKPSGQEEWGAAELAEYADALHGRRMVHTFGVSYAEDVEDHHAGEVKVQAEPLCTMNRLHVLAHRGDAYARLGLELLAQRPGLIGAMALGDRPRPPALPVALTEADDARLLHCLRSVSSRHPHEPLPPRTCWEEAAERQRAFEHRQHAFWWIPAEKPPNEPGTP